MKYEITVTETCEATYVVEADNPEEASNIFSEWADTHSEWIGDDLMDGTFGWEYSDPIETNECCYADIRKEAKV